MNQRFIILGLLILMMISSSLSLSLTSCPCQDQSLCQPLDIEDRPEFLGFSSFNDSYETYDWDTLTTIAVFYSPVPSELLCLAHSKGVRLVYGVDYPIAQLGNTTFQTEWIAHQLEMVQSSYFDGVNFDVESPIWSNESTVSALLTGVVAQTNLEFKRVFPRYQVTVDVAWSPNCIDGRCYDYFGLAQASDFLIVMDYDTRSQIFSDVCTASANSPPLSVLAGMSNFTALGISPNKLVMGLPWYGYVYPCVNAWSLETMVCNIKSVPFRGVNCSDAAGTQFMYSYILTSLLYNSSIINTGELWDSELGSPFFNYLDPDTQQLYQVWYDNPESISIKVSIAQKLGLRGMSIWNIDFLNQSTQPTQTMLMWDAIASFFKQPSNKLI